VRALRAADLCVCVFTFALYWILLLSVYIANIAIGIVMIYIPVLFVFVRTTSSTASVFRQQL